MALLYILRDHLPQPSVSWKKAPQQIEPSSSFLFSEHPSLAQKPLYVQSLCQKVQADPEHFPPALVFAQKLHKVHDVLHDVHHFAQISENVHDEISKILTYVSSKKNVSW